MLGLLITDLLDLYIPIEPTEVEKEDWGEGKGNTVEAKVKRESRQMTFSKHFHLAILSRARTHDTKAFPDWLPPTSN